MTSINLAIFASGSGTNCENIIRHFKNSDLINIALVVCNRAEAKVVERARRLGVDTRIITKAMLEDEQTFLPMLREYGIDFIVLAGFLLMIPAYLIEEFDRKMINIHPSLLPKFGGKGMFGMHVHEAVFKAREQKTGFTVHWVTEKCDGGEIVMQCQTDLLPTDGIEAIAQKEHELEMKFFPKIIERLVLDCFKDGR